MNEPQTGEEPQRAQIVKLGNDFNKIALAGFNALQLDLLMAIASRVRDKGVSEVEFSFDELRKLIKLSKNLTNKEFGNLIAEVNRKLVTCSYTFDTIKRGTRVTVSFALFQKFEVWHELYKLSVRVNQEFAFLLNNLQSNFTVMELRQFVGLRSVYAKECYRRVKQFRTTGVWRVSFDEFCRLMDVPKHKTRKLTLDYLDHRVLPLIEDELGPLLGLRVEKIFGWSEGATRRGRKPLRGFAFHFDKERPRPAPPRSKASRATPQPVVDYDRAGSHERPEDVAEREKAKPEGKSWLEALAAYNREHGTNLGPFIASQDPAVMAELDERMGRR